MGKNTLTLKPPPYFRTKRDDALLWIVFKSFNFEHFNDT